MRSVVRRERVDKHEQEQPHPGDLSSHLGRSWPSKSLFRWMHNAKYIVECRQKPTSYFSQRDLQVIRLCLFSTPAQWIINYLKLKQSENLQVDVTHGSGTAEQQRATAVSCKIGGDALTSGEMNKRFHDHFLLFHQCFIECFLLLFLIPEENQPRDRCCPAAQFGNFASERSRASAISPSPAPLAG